MSGADNGDNNNYFNRCDDDDDDDDESAAASGRRGKRTTTDTGLQAAAAVGRAAAALLHQQRPHRVAVQIATLVVVVSASLRCGWWWWWWCVGATGCTARTTTAGCKLTGCGCCCLPAICCLAAVITSLSLMRSRAAAFTDVNATAGGRGTVVGRDEDAAVEAAAAAAVTAIAATADNATTFRRPLLPPPPTNQTNTATAVDGDHVHHQPQSLGTVMVLMVVTVVVLGTVGLLTCVLHHYNQQYNPVAPGCLTAAPRPHHCRLSTPSPPPPSKKNLQVASPTSTVVASPPNRSCTSGSAACSTSSRTAMLTMRSHNAGLSREHDRQVRLHSVRTDLELDLPPRIHLPDGEEYPYGSTAKLHLRNSEQEQEIYQKCIKGPPNRTIWSSSISDCGKLSQPQRCNSAVSGLTSLSTFPSEVDSVTRCNSVSSRYVCLPRTAGFPPAVDNNIQSLSSLTMVPCLSHVDKQSMGQ